jgi:hypothetical protein
LKYTIYRTTNLVNGKIYIGCHKTNNPNDEYLGSGKLLKYSIGKYGIENFKKEVLYVFDDEESMFAKEKELVTEKFCKRDDTYNICEGGKGGWSFYNREFPNGMLGKKQTVKQKLVASKILALHIEKNPNFQSIVGKLGNKNSPGFRSKKHSKESLEKMSGPREKSKGEKNSQYGTMWITNGCENRKIKTVDNIPEGWYKGRI